MMSLGKFEHDTKTGKFTGVMFGVNFLPMRLAFEPAVTQRGHAYYKIHAHCQSITVEVGEAWPNYAATGNATLSLSVKLWSPGLLYPFYGKLMVSETNSNLYHLLWDETGTRSRVETNIRR